MLKPLANLVLLIAFAANVQASQYHVQTAGAWNNPSIWDVYPGMSLSAIDSVFISADVSIPTALSSNGYIAIDANVTLTNLWSVDGTGTVVNNGTIQNNSNWLVRGSMINNGVINSSSDLIITGTGTFETYGVYVNDGGFLNYIGSQVKLYGSVTNDDYMSLGSNLSIKNTGSDSFTNNGFFIFSAQLRLEGHFVNTSSGQVNYSSSSTVTYSDDARWSNSGSFMLSGDLHISTVCWENSDIGSFTVSVFGDLIVHPFINSIL